MPTTSLPTILLVEDDFVLRTSLAEFFASNGFAVESAAHGLEAFARLNSIPHKPSVIVLDILMPYMDGIEFRALQRAIPAVADIPVVVITASPHRAAEADGLGVKETFFKPVNASRLLARLQELTASSN